MKLFIALMLVASVYASAQMPLPYHEPKKMTKVESPKGSEFSSSMGTAMVNPRTNRVLRLSFSWTRPSTGVDGFKLCFGSAKSVYTNVISVGSVTNYTLSITNWSEIRVRHFFAVKSIKANVESVPSNEVFWPPYEPSHIRISWPNATGSVTIQEATSLGAKAILWRNSATIIGTNTWTTNILSGTHFFRINRPVKLSIDAFNPLNL